MHLDVGLSSPKSVASLGGPHLSQLSQVKLNLVYLLLLNFTLYSLPDQCFALALTELK